MGVWNDRIDEFERVVRSAARALRARSDAEATARPRPDGWSPKEVVGHLVDSASNNHQRFVRAAFTQDLCFPGYEQQPWVELQRYRDAPWHELLDLFESFNLHLARLARALPADALTRPRREHALDRIAWETVPADEPATLAYFVLDYVGHLFHHLRQVDPALAPEPRRQRDG